MDMTPPHAEPVEIKPMMAREARKRRGPVLYVLGLLIVLAAGGATLWFAKTQATQVAQARTTLQAEVDRGPRVQVVPVRQGPQTRDILLLGDARPYVSTTIFAKVSGYLKTVLVDKGDMVKAGQILAVIDSAETESQYQSALADRDNKLKLAARARELTRAGTTSIQSAEQADTNLRMAEEAVRNYATLTSYETIRAPFDGTITSRFADPGSLLQAALTNQTSSLPLLTLSDNSRLRIGAYVEQRDVTSIKVGDPAEIIDASNADRHVTAKISRTAGMLDPRTRTLYIEIDVDNSQGFLLAGSFANVRLQVPLVSHPQIPVTAMFQRNGQQMVALIDDSGRAKLQPIHIASTNGILIDVIDGVKPGDKVAINVPDDVTDGGRVRPALIAAK